VPTTFLQDVPHDQKIFFVTHLQNDGQLLFELRSKASMVSR
jgi:hypothetical protein